MEKQGFRITYLPIGRNGIVDPDIVKNAITPKTILISIMHANNEIGTIQPIDEIGKIARERNIYFHTDAVQTFGHLDIDVQKMNVDLLALSAHKLYGPKGTGVLYLRDGISFIPLIHGGGQEKGRRSSTQNTPGIVGLAKAAEIANQTLKQEQLELSRLRHILWEKIQDKIENVHLNGHPEKRLPNNLNISIEQIEGESLLMNLDMEGISASSGSACSSGSGNPSHVLSAMNLSPELSRGSLRLTLGRFTTENEINKVSDVLAKVVNHLRSMSSF